MQKKSACILNIGGVDCAAAADEKFNKWYDEVHIPMLMKGGDIKRVTRLKRLGGGTDYPHYLIIYEYEDQAAFDRYEKSQAKAEAMEEMRRTWAEGGSRRKWRVQYEVIRTFEK